MSFLLYFISTVKLIFSKIIFIEICSTGAIFNKLSLDYRLLEKIDARRRRVNRRTN